MTMTPAAKRAVDFAYRDAEHVLAEDRSVQVLFAALIALHQSRITVNALLVKFLDERWTVNQPELVTQALNAVAEERAHKQQINPKELIPTMLQNVIPGLDIVRHILEEEHATVSRTNTTEPSLGGEVHGSRGGEQEYQGSEEDPGELGGQGSGASSSEPYVPGDGDSD